MPFVETVTMASTCNLVFRRKFLEPDVIGLMPPLGYVRRDIESLRAFQYLSYVDEKQFNGELKYAGKERGQHRTRVFHNGPREFKCDGYHADSNSVVFVNGCFFHAHQSSDCCINTASPQQAHPLKGISMERVYQQTLSVQKAVENAGYNVQVVWECEILDLLQNDDDFKSFVLNSCDPSLMDMKNRLSPRDCFFGGRTGNVSYFSEAQDGEEIEYIDIISLYPFSQFTGTFPKGHPAIITKSALFNYNVDAYFGLMKCSVLPPKQLSHGILPCKLKDKSGDVKLFFPLCRTCAELSEVGSCQHDDDLRTLHGSWSTPEIYFAMQNGYRLVKIYEVYHWPKKTTDVFKSYICFFLKLKVQASGYPSSCNTQEAKDAFVADYESRYGVELDPLAIKKDSALKQFAKFCLNNLWGFLAKNNNGGKLHFVSTGRELLELLDDSSLECSAFNLNSKTMLVNTKVKKEFNDVFSDKKTSLVLAIFVTAYSRIKLCRSMLVAGSSVLYFDTDSLIYKHPSGLPTIPTGNFLGDWESELKGDLSGYKIVKFVSGGPKNYAYMAKHPQKPPIFVVKIRGFTLHSKASSILDFNVMVNVIQTTLNSFFQHGCKWPLPDGELKMIRVPQFQIMKERRGFELNALVLNKIYSIVPFSKRRPSSLCGSGRMTSLPFGYA